MNSGVLYFAVLLAALSSFAQSTPQHPLPPRPPDDLSSTATIVPANEPGEPLVIDGQVFSPDGTTLATGGDGDSGQGEVFLWRAPRNQEK